MAAINMNRKMFEEMLKGDKPVLVDFWAPWCTYCRKIESAYEQVAQQYGDRLIVAKVNIDDEPLLAQQEKIEIIPTLVMYQGGKAIGSIVAPESKAMIDAFIAETLGVSEEKRENKVYDMVVIGGGPGGYTAALYAARSGLETVVLEKLSAGGQMALTHQIDNYPGFEEGIDGFALGQKMRAQAERFGAKTEIAEVLSVDLKADPKVIETNLGTVYGKTVVIATGANPRELGIGDERELIGRGVNYCAACDGMFYKGKTVVVVGGGNSAAADAAILSRLAQKVIIVHRRDTLRATKVYHKPLEDAQNIQFQWNSVVTELLHDDKVTGVRLKNVLSGEETALACDGVFVSVGRKPATKLFEGQIELDQGGYILAGESTKTSIPGVFAVGDVRTKALRQVVTAVADGAVAVHHAEEYLAQQKAS
ncbi:MAG: thioredoxin-disulfide reductase [Clostridia bacterium]|nr:thioredoxin-disulfide reductase [Clostridia bacterium]